MNKLQLYCLLFCCFLFRFLNGQVVVSPEFEVVGSTLITKANAENFKSRGGWGIGVNVSIWDNRMFSLVMGAQFNNNFYWTNRKGGTDGVYSSGTEAANAIAFPILVRYGVGGQTRFIAEVGPTVEIPLTFDPTYYVGIHGGLGVRFPLGLEEMVVKAFYRYSSGWDNADFNNDFRFRPQFIGISVAYKLIK